MSAESEYQPPFPYFGGKSLVAPMVWDLMGDVDNYVEPFCGSCAVLMLRPGGGRGVETVNDADGLLANFWRAVKNDPDAVAAAADNPVLECDLHARHLWLLGQRERITERLCGDPDFFDAKAAGWWCWGSSCWIGAGWCDGRGPWTVIDGKIAKRPEGDAGRGVNRKRPNLSRAGRGVNRKRPNLGNAGQGVNRQRPFLGNAGQGECERRAEWLRGYIRSIADRLRNVRVCCGDWLRVCASGTTTTKHGMTGVFLDPPYADTANRDSNLYAVDCLKVAHRVREWAIANGSDPLMRIVLAGYEGEHQMPADWRVIEWAAQGGYGHVSGDNESAGKANRFRERLWCSPGCVHSARPLGLFADL